MRTSSTLAAAQIQSGDRKITRKSEMAYVHVDTGPEERVA